jgi:nicotinamide phosphoribosyltransferase
MFTVEATDKVVAPLVGISETILTHVWHPSNVATIGMDIRLVLEKAFEKTDDETTNFLLDFMLHDFGFRGVSSVESAGAGGCAHLIPFKGTDTLIGIRYAQRYYGAGMAGFSVAASEHSIMTSLGEAGEFDVVRQLIARYSKGILSVVMDSYNTERFIRVCGTTLKDAILNRDGKFVFRPDSPRFKGDKACDQILWIAQQLEHYFGATVNKKGYKVLNPKVGIIYGDGLSVDEIKESIDLLVKSGYAASTCVYGMGGGLLQKHNRDTQRNAFKCSAQFRGNEWVDIFKNPLDKTKASKRGRMKLVWNESSHAKTLVTVPETDSRPDVMQTVFENGEMVREYTWNEVQTNSKLRFAGM